MPLIASEYGRPMAAPVAATAPPAPDPAPARGAAPPPPPIAPDEPDEVELMGNAEAEMAILGWLLLAPSVEAAQAEAAELRELVRPEDFSDRDVGRCFGAALALVDADELPDAVSVADRVKATSGRDLRFIVTDAMGFAPVGTPAGPARQVRRHADARRLLAGVEREAAQLRAGRITPQQFAGVMADLALAVATPGREGFVPAKVAVDELSDLLLAREASGGKLTGVPTGFSTFDHETSGFRPGELVVIAGAPGSGKTAVGLQIALNNALCDLLLPGLGLPAIPVGFVSAEMQRTDLMERGVCNLARINTKALRKMELAQDEYPRMAHALMQLRRMPMHLDHTASPDVRETIARARALKAREPGIRLMIVDFLQLLTSGDEDGRAEELRAVSYALKGMAKSLNVAVVALAQVNDKAVELRADKRPQLADLQGSSGLRQAADFVFLCYRPIMYEDADPRDLEVNVAKARGLPTITHMLGADMRYMRIADRGSL